MIDECYEVSAPTRESAGHFFSEFRREFPFCDVIDGADYLISWKSRDEVRLLASIMRHFLTFQDLTHEERCGLERMVEDIDEWLGDCCRDR